MQNLIKYRKCLVDGIEGICFFYGLELMPDKENRHGINVQRITRVALVEYPDGRMDKINPIRIQFLDRTKSPKVGNTAETIGPTEEQVLAFVKQVVNDDNE